MHYEYTYTTRSICLTEPSFVAPGGDWVALLV